MLGAQVVDLNKRQDGAMLAHALRNGCIHDISLDMCILFSEKMHISREISRIHPLVTCP